jgi:hypothetical protein
VIATCKLPGLTTIVATIALCFGVACGHASRKVETLSNKVTVTRTATSTGSSTSSDLDASQVDLPDCSSDALNTGNGYGEQLSPTTRQTERCRIPRSAGQTDDEPATELSTGTGTRTDAGSGTETVTSTGSGTDTGTAASTPFDPGSNTSPGTPSNGSDRWTDPNDPSKSFRYCTSDASDADANGVKDGWGWEFDPAVGADASCKVRS